jgi:ABC-type bacteriocin/lantibiotic exporter with double-glycine peptidase domain
VARGDDEASERPPTTLAQRINECGVASVYCALGELGIPVRVEDIVERFTSIHGNNDLSSLSMQEVTQVLRQFGVSASAVRFDPADVDQVPIPAILYTAPRFRSEYLGTGHFAVLVQVHDDYATITDLTMVSADRPDGSVLVHKGRLRGVWKGEAILLSAQSTGLSRLFANRNLAGSACVLSIISIALGINTVRMKSNRAKPNE